MRIVQGEARVMREVTEIVEVMLLAVALFATSLHRAFVHILVTLDAGLSSTEVTQLTFGQDCFVRMGMAIDAGQGLMATVELIVDRAVVESIRTDQTSKSEAARTTEFDTCSEVFDMAASTEHLLRSVKLAVQAFAQLKLFSDRWMTLQTSLCQLGNSRCTGKMRGASAMTSNAVTAAVEIRDLSVNRSDRSRAGIAEVQTQHCDDNGCRNQRQK